MVVNTLLRVAPRPNAGTTNNGMNTNKGRHSWELSLGDKVEFRTGRVVAGRGNWGGNSLTGELLEFGLEEGRRDGVGSGTPGRLLVGWGLLLDQHWGRRLDGRMGGGLSMVVLMVLLHKVAPHAVELVDGPLRLGDLGTVGTLVDPMVRAATTVTGFALSLLQVEERSRESMNDLVFVISWWIPVSVSCLGDILGSQPCLSGLELFTGKGLLEVLNTLGILVSAIHSICIGHNLLVVAIATVLQTCESNNGHKLLLG